MKILVPIKRVVDPSVAVRVSAGGDAIDDGGLRGCMNPFDEIAVEQAVRFKEAGLAGEVVVVSCGGAESQETLRSALAIGADRGVLVETTVPPSPLGVAKLLRAVCGREQPALVICGKQAVDDDAAQVGPMLAGLLGWPQATFASRIELAGDVLNVRRDIDGGHEFVQLCLPAVVSTELGLCEARYASLPNIMKARKKPIASLRPDELGVALAPRLVRLRLSEAARPRGGRRVDDVAALVRALRDDDVLHVAEGR